MHMCYGLYTHRVSLEENKEVTILTGFENGNWSASLYPLNFLFEHIMYFKN